MVCSSQMQSDSVSQSQSSSAVIRARQALIDYIKRCCCAYVNHRMELIKRLRWKHGGILPNSVKENLSTAEVEWFNEYNKLLADYQASLSDKGLNLMSSLLPPKELYVQVRALRDFGEFETTDGTVIVLNENSLHNLPIQDCDMLIKQGVLEVVGD
ncbi:unnamed protein product [Dracunculus medinensis]|uniref:DNA replication complex GINS protein PSF1 n=1 Tax=Dracunculus medinensis TaxID=318479 RepID=A0A0N4UCN5_DRAME|nr:unnamed protein product [Dracunculus medinensis]